jgi:serine carboxypeptidase-like clade I
MFRDPDCGCIITGAFIPPTERALHKCPFLLSYFTVPTYTGLDALIYSGDHDLCVPHTGTEAWTSSLGLPIKDTWRPWTVTGSQEEDSSQVAGYAVHYEGLVYATMKGAGHMVPQSKPAEALEMVRRWLHGRSLL